MHSGSIKTILIIQFFLSLTTFTIGQERNDNQISRKWAGWKMNGERISWKEVKSNIQQVPGAVPFLKKGLNSRRLFYISYIPLAASLLFIQDPDFPQIRSTRNTVYYITNFLSTACIIYFGIRAVKNLKMAIRIHNENRAIVY